MTDPFIRRVSEGMRRSGLTLRSFCREVGLDPSFFSKVLSGKRSPPSEEEVLRRIAGRLSIDAAELIVSAGRIPSEWRAVWSDPDLFDSMHQIATGKKSSPKIQPERTEHVRKPAPQPRPAPAPILIRRPEMSEELL